MKSKISVVTTVLLLALLGFATPSFASTDLPAPSGQNAFVLKGINSSNVEVSKIFGAATTSSWTDKIGFKYIPESNRYICQVDAKLSRNGTGSATSNVQLQVYSSGSNMDNGTLMYTSSNVWTHQDFTTSAQLASFYFGTASSPGNCFGVKGGSTYWFTWSRTDAPSDTVNWNFYFVNNVPSPSSATAQGYTKAFGAVTGSSIYPDVNLYGILDGTGISTANTQPCDDNILYSLCSVLYKYLIPDTAVVSSNYTTLQTTFNSKAPFAYINSALGLDFSLTSSSSAIPFISIPLNHSTNPYIASSLPTSMNYTDSSNGNVVSQWAGAVRTVFLVLLWLSFIFYIFKTVEHIF